MRVKYGNSCKTLSVCVSCSVVSNPLRPHGRYSLPGYLSMGFPRQEHRSGLLFPSPWYLPNPGIELGSPALQADSLPSESPEKMLRAMFNTTLYIYIYACVSICLYLTNLCSTLEAKVKVKVQISQSCPTLCDPVGYTVHGILQARILEWVAFPFSRGSSQPRDQIQVSHITGGFFTS